MQIDIRERIGEDRAVSPVIGVILMVAITVILAAVIGTFVLDLGQNVQNTGPSASMGFSDADDTWNSSANDSDFIVVEHQSGQPLDADSIRIVVRNATNNAIVAEWDSSGEVKGNFTLNGVGMTVSDTISTGDVIVIANDSASSPAFPSNSDDAAGSDYSVTVVSTETDNRIATGVVEVN